MLSLWSKSYENKSQHPQSVMNNTTDAPQTGKWLTRWTSFADTNVEDVIVQDAVWGWMGLDTGFIQVSLCWRRSWIEANWGNSDRTRGDTGINGWTRWSRSCEGGLSLSSRASYLPCLLGDLHTVVHTLLPRVAHVDAEQRCSHTETWWHETTLETHCKHVARLRVSKQTRAKHRDTGSQLN